MENQLLFNPTPISHSLTHLDSTPSMAIWNQPFSSAMDPQLQLPHLNNTAPSSSSSNVAQFSPDPGFVERAARFSCFGSKSLNGPQFTNQMGNNYRSQSHLSIANQKLSPLSTAPLVKPLGSETNLQERNNDSSSPEHESSLSISNPRKRKSIPKAKFKEPGSVKKVKTEEEDSKKNDANSKVSEDTKKDYIHVRARRGQATDSHSLAERVRREKISERMKLLQDLVPGCNKVTGKALMLDEIINYVQSLQHQVEFLSMKLSSVNTTRVDFNMDSLISKPIYQSTTNLPNSQISPIDSSASRFYGQPQNPSLDSVLCQNLPNQFPPPNSFLHHHSHYPSYEEDELQSIVQMGFVQDQTQEISLQSHNFNLGSDQKKIEL